MRLKSSSDMDLCMCARDDLASGPVVLLLLMLSYSISSVVVPERCNQFGDVFCLLWWRCLNRLCSDGEDLFDAYPQTIL